MSKAKFRNMSWVYEHALAVASQKKGIARGMFTAGEIVEALGFSRNTVKGHIETLIEMGHIETAVLSKSVTIYRVKELAK